MTIQTEVFLTGGTGFLGEHFLRLLIAEGFAVTALYRSSSKRDHLADLDITWVLGDVTDGPVLTAAVTSFAEAARARDSKTWFVHGAAVISYATASGPLQDQANVEGTRNAVAAAEAASVDRMLYVSSVVAVGLASGPMDSIDETAPFESVQRQMGRPYVGHYMRTKYLAEQLVHEANARDLDVVIVNPGAIFGEAQELSNTAEIFGRVDKSIIGRFAGPGSLSVVGVTDVARGMLLALERGTKGERYLLCERNLQLRELMEAIAKQLGHNFRIRTLGPRAWALLVFATRMLDLVKPLHLVTPTALQLLSVQLRFDSSKARRELGWEPAPFDEVLAETVAWLRRIGQVG